MRLLVIQDKDQRVGVIYADFQWIARRHKISDRKEQFDMASKVIASITSAVAAK